MPISGEVQMLLCMSGSVFLGIVAANIYMLWVNRKRE